MNTLIWFYVSLIQNDEDKIIERLLVCGFSKQDEMFCDGQDRCVKIIADEHRLEIGIPRTDVLDEQEQLEFILARLLLADEAKRL